MTPKPQVEVPEDVLDAVLATTFKDAKTVRRELAEEVRELLQGALPALYNHWKEEERCGECEDTGIYEEGDEWAPCNSCVYGAAALDAARRTHANVSEELRQQLLSDGSVEAAALALFGGFTGDWSGLTEAQVEKWRNKARAAIQAAAESLQEQPEGYTPCRACAQRLPSDPCPNCATPQEPEDLQPNAEDFDAWEADHDH